MEQFFAGVVGLLGIYLVVGVLFTVVFLWKGISKVDEATIGAGVFFKVLVFPGLVAFWPLFLIKWIKA